MTPLLLVLILIVLICAFFPSLAFFLFVQLPLFTGALVIGWWILLATFAVLRGIFRSLKAARA